MEAASNKLNFYPFAYALFDECLEKHCWYCLDDEKKLKRCTGCQNAMFCDKSCQSLGWKDHKFECKGINKNSGKVPDIEVRLLGRIVSRHKAILCGIDKKDADFYKDRTSNRKIMDIWAHTEKIKNDDYAIKKFEGIYERLNRFYDSKAMLNKQIIFELHCRDFINRHAISDKHYLREIGKGLYLDLCQYDHSCRPNTVYSCNSFIATLRSLNSNVNLMDIKSTFYSYIDLLCTKQDRRKLLKDTWYFECQCERCLDESEQILSSMLCPSCEYSLCIFGKLDYKDPETQLITCPNCSKKLEKGQVLEAISAMCFINEVIEQTNLQEMGNANAQKFLQDLLSRYQKLLPPINVYMCKIVQALLPFIDPTDSTLLLNLHLNVENCLRICYPHNHPALAFHLRNIGIFSKNLGKRKMALKYLEEALEMFKFVMGKEHSLSNITEQIFEEAKNLPEEKIEKEVENGIKRKIEINIEKDKNEPDENEAKQKNEAKQDNDWVDKTAAKKRKKRQNKNKQIVKETSFEETKQNTKETSEIQKQQETQEQQIEKHNELQKQQHLQKQQEIQNQQKHKQLSKQQETQKQDEIQKQQQLQKRQETQKHPTFFIETPPIIFVEADNKIDEANNLNDYNNNKKIINNHFQLNPHVLDEDVKKNDGGVKKKLLQKKSVPRASTPMYCKNVLEKNNEKNNKTEEESTTSAIIFLNNKADNNEADIEEKIKLNIFIKEEEINEEEEVKNKDENNGWQLKQRRRKSKRKLKLNL